MTDLTALIERLEKRRDEVLAKARTCASETNRQYHYGKFDAFNETLSLLRSLETSREG